MIKERSILRLGTRGSLLARTQAQAILDQLSPFFPGQIVMEIITTSGDQRSAFASPLHPPTNSTPLVASNRPANKAEFVKEIEEALLGGRIDLAVHSAKDLPLVLPAGLMIGATPRREVPNDMWIGRGGIRLAELPLGATVGSSSLRREAQLRLLRPDLKVVPLRGNIDTRLKRVEGISDPDRTDIIGTFLAAAGLRRVGMVPAHGEMLTTEQFIPAVGQGTLALECRADDELVRNLIAHIHDATTAAALACERRVIRTLSGSCLAPIGVCAEPRIPAPPPLPSGSEATKEGNLGGGWIVRAIVASLDGRQFARAALLTEDPSPSGLAALTPQLITVLESRGASEILAKIPS